MAFCPVCQREHPDDWKRCPHDGAVLLSSRTVGKYAIETLIGAGGMGAVYRATNPDTRADVAVKLLHPSAAASEALRARFQREAEAIAQLRTRHVVRIYDFGTDGETLYLVMELLDGHSLRAEIQPPPERMSPARIDMVVDGALRGLAAAHRANVTHRDLKPENIFVAATDDGEVAKILDFGIARVDNTTLTDTGALMGTPAYMAPEQVSASRGRLGPHTDCYAMAVILYEMLTGRSPFVADRVSEVLARVIDRQFDPLGEVRGDLPEPVIELVTRGMAVDTGERFRDADEMRLAWRRAYAAFDEVGSIGAAHVSDDVSAHARTDLAGEATADTMAAPVRSKASRWAVLGLVAAGGIGAGIYAITRDTAQGALPGTDAAASAPPVAVTDAAPDLAPIPDGMAELAGAELTLGSPFYPRYPDADPERRARVERFYIDLREAAAPGGEPLRDLTFAEATAWCAERGKRLPTESEWELAARRGPLDPAKANLKRGDRSAPAATGSHPGDCTPDGVCDLLGNVAEWTDSPWRAGGGEPDDKRRAVRGASFKVAPAEPFFASIHARFALPVDGGKDPEVGFRCAMTPPREAQ
jgi:serine/threonine-protein kinase